MVLPHSATAGSSESALCVVKGLHHHDRVCHDLTACRCHQLLSPSPYLLVPAGLRASVLCRLQHAAGAPACMTCRHSIAQPTHGRVLPAVLVFKYSSTAQVHLRLLQCSCPCGVALYEHCCSTQRLAACATSARLTLLRPASQPLLCRRMLASAAAQPPEFHPHPAACGAAQSSGHRDTQLGLQLLHMCPATYSLYGDLACWYVHDAAHLLGLRQ